MQAFCAAKPWRRANKVNCRTAAREGGLGHSFLPSIEIPPGPPQSGLCGVAAKLLEFEVAAALRDQIIQLRGKEK